MQITGQTIVVETVNGKIKVYADDQSNVLFMSAVQGTTGSCQVTGTIDDDGNWTEGPACRSSGCSGQCTLKSRMVGSKTHYWCDCV